ncbi:hypothetical protein PRUPE_8G253500 [Prunus persica]|uniref:Bidirectional sugar transporter SWEET n=1 Tax=Prunus persica TaxID=3760 RepID=M5VK11_PRUPE|nr:bidirectional sugar transporter SWEET9 [Prunus persica]ONH93801.1 hypothetical protein PRUPE_8G253500 [Prunus persica]
MAAPDAFLLASVFGILGNIVAFMVYLAPLPTFYRIFKKKSTEGFQSIPYSVALFSAMLMLYYAFLKTNAFMLITINSVGCIIETSYLVMYMIYAPAKTRIYTAKLLVLFNVGVYGVIVLSTYLIPNHFLRIKVVGWISVVFSVCVFAAPLSIMRLVIRTRSVEFMSFPLSFCLTLCAVMWFFYGLLVRDLFIAAPNILGFAFGLAQMIMYLMFKNSKKSMLPEFSLNQIPNVVAVNDIVASDSQLKTEDTKKSSEAEENQSTESMTNDRRAGDAAAAEPNESIV